MGRLSADRALTKRFPVSRQAIWEAIRRLRVDFTLAALIKETRQDRRTIGTYVDCLKAGGYLSCEKVDRFVAATYTLRRDEGAEAPRLRGDGTPVTMGSAREQMWRTMKIVGQFTAAQLAVQASLPESPVSEVDAKDYCKRLASAGYLATVSPGRSGSPGAPAVFRFVPSKNTGPLPPMVQRLKTVFDPNLGQIVWSEEPRT